MKRMRPGGSASILLVAEAMATYVREGLGKRCFCEMVCRLCCYAAMGREMAVSCVPLDLPAACLGKGSMIHAAEAATRALVASWRPADAAGTDLVVLCGIRKQCVQGVVTASHRARLPSLSSTTKQTLLPSPHTPNAHPNLPKRERAVQHGTR